MKILHVVPGLDELANGIAVAAKLIAGEQKADLVEARLFACGKCDFSLYDEVWVHSAWLPMALLSCMWALKSGKRFVRMSHANYDPVRLAYHGWKKWLVGPIERYFLRRADRIVATCEAEKGWIFKYEPRVKKVEVTDIKRFFSLEFRVSSLESGSGNCELRVESCELRGERRALHLLYLGRRHPLKGLEFLEEAVKEVEGCELRIVSNAFGEEKEKVWEWCDVMVLPTLSENFGLVVAEALGRGKRVITTDGAPAWGENLSRVEGKGMNSRVDLVERVEGGELSIRAGYGGRLLYLVGYREGSEETRVRLLKEAIGMLKERG